jgi:signal transduction histidine kinase
LWSLSFCFFLAGFETLRHPSAWPDAISAVCWYAEGFEQRSNIKVTLEIDKYLGRLPRDLETTVFRVLQECLTNVHRHSRSKTAAFVCCALMVRCGSRLRRRPRGSPRQDRIGTSGMRERIEQFGGEPKIDSENGHGTLVSTTIPLGHVANQPNNANRPAKFWTKLLHAIKTMRTGQRGIGLP